MGDEFGGIPQSLGFTPGSPDDASSQMFSNPFHSGDGGTPIGAGLGMPGTAQDMPRRTGMESVSRFRPTAAPGDMVADIVASFHRGGDRGDAAYGLNVELKTLGDTVSRLEAMLFMVGAIVDGVGSTTASIWEALHDKQQYAFEQRVLEDGASTYIVSAIDGEMPVGTFNTTTMAVAVAATLLDDANAPFAWNVDNQACVRLALSIERLAQYIGNGMGVLIDEAIESAAKKTSGRGVSAADALAVGVTVKNLARMVLPSDEAIIHTVYSLSECASWRQIVAFAGRYASLDALDGNMYTGIAEGIGLRALRRLFYTPSPATATDRASGDEVWSSWVAPMLPLSGKEALARDGMLRRVMELVVSASVLFGQQRALEYLGLPLGPGRDAAGNTIPTGAMSPVDRLLLARHVEVLHAVLEMVDPLEAPTAQAGGGGASTATSSSQSLTEDDPSRAEVRWTPVFNPLASGVSDDSLTTLSGLVRDAMGTDRWVSAMANAGVAVAFCNTAVKSSPALMRLLGTNTSALERKVKDVVATVNALCQFYIAGRAPGDFFKSLRELLAHDDIEVDQAVRTMQATAGVDMALSEPVRVAMDKVTATSGGARSLLGYNNILCLIENIWICGVTLPQRPATLFASRVPVTFHAGAVLGPQRVATQDIVLEGDVLTSEAFGRVVVDAFRSDRMTLDDPATVTHDNVAPRDVDAFLAEMSDVASPGRPGSVSSFSSPPVAVGGAAHRRLLFQSTSGHVAVPSPPTPPATPPRSAPPEPAAPVVNVTPPRAEVSSVLDMAHFGVDMMPGERPVALLSPGAATALLPAAPLNLGWMTTQQAASDLVFLGGDVVRALLPGFTDPLQRFRILSNAWWAMLRPHIADVGLSGWASSCTEAGVDMDMEVLNARAWAERYIERTDAAFAAIEEFHPDALDVRPGEDLPLHAPIPPGLVVSTVAAERNDDDGFLDVSLVMQPFNVPIPTDMTVGLGWAHHPPTAFTSADWMGQSLLRGTGGVTNTNLVSLRAAATTGWLASTQPVDAMTLNPPDFEPAYVSAGELIAARVDRAVVDPVAEATTVGPDPNKDRHAHTGNGICAVGDHPDDEVPVEWDATLALNHVQPMRTEDGAEIAVLRDENPTPVPIVTVYPMGHPHFLDVEEENMDHGRALTGALNAAGAVTGWTPTADFMIPAVFGNHATFPKPGTPHPDGTLQCTLTLAMHAVQCDGAAVLNGMSHGSPFLTAAVKALVDEFNRPVGGTRTVADSDAAILGLVPNGISIHRARAGLARLLEVHTRAPRGLDESTVVLSDADVSAANVLHAWRESFPAHTLPNAMDTAAAALRAQTSPFNAELLHKAFYCVDVVAGTDTGAPHTSPPLADWTTCVRAVQSSFDAAASFLRYVPETGMVHKDSALELTQSASTLGDAVAINNLMWRRFLGCNLVDELREAGNAVPLAMQMDAASEESLRHGEAVRPREAPFTEDPEAAPRWNAADKWATLVGLQSPMLAVVSRAVCRAITNHKPGGGQQALPPSQRSGTASGQHAFALGQIMDTRSGVINIGAAAREIERGFVAENIGVKDVTVAVDGLTEYLCGVALEPFSAAEEATHFKFRYRNVRAKAEWTANSRTYGLTGIVMPEDFTLQTVHGAGEDTFATGRVKWFTDLAADNRAVAANTGLSEDTVTAATVESLRHILVVHLALVTTAGPRLRVTVPVFLGREAAMGALIPWGTPLVDLLTWDLVHVMARSLSPTAFGATSAIHHVNTAHNLAFVHTVDAPWAVPVNPSTDAVGDLWQYPENLAAMYGAVYAGMGTQLLSSTMGYVSGYTSPHLRQFSADDDKGWGKPNRVAADIDWPHHDDPAYTPGRPETTPVRLDPKGRPTKDQLPRLSLARVNGTGLGVHRGWVAAAVTQAAHGAKTRFDFMGVMSDDNVPRPADGDWLGDIPEEVLLHHGGRKTWAPEVTRSLTGTSTTVPENMGVTGRYNVGICAIGAPLFWALGGNEGMCHLQSVVVTRGVRGGFPGVRIASGSRLPRVSLEVTGLQARAAFTAAVHTLITRKDTAVPLLLPRRMMQKLPRLVAVGVFAEMDVSSGTAKWKDGKHPTRAASVLAPALPSLEHNGPESGEIAVGTPWNGLTLSNTSVMTHTLAFDVGGGKAYLASDNAEMQALVEALEFVVKVERPDDELDDLVVHTASVGLGDLCMTPSRLADAMQKRGRALPLLTTMVLPAMRELAGRLSATEPSVATLSAMIKREAPIRVVADELSEPGTGAPGLKFVDGRAMVEQALAINDARRSDIVPTSTRIKRAKENYRRRMLGDTLSEPPPRPSRPPPDTPGVPVYTPPTDAQLALLDRVSSVAPRSSMSRNSLASSLSFASSLSTTPSALPPRAQRALFTSTGRSVRLSNATSLEPVSELRSPLKSAADAEEQSERDAALDAPTAGAGATPGVRPVSVPDSAAHDVTGSSRAAVFPADTLITGRSAFEHIPAGMPVIAMAFAALRSGKDANRSYVLRWMPQLATQPYGTVHLEKYAIMVNAEDGVATSAPVHMLSLLTRGFSNFVRFEAAWEGAVVRDNLRRWINAADTNPIFSDLRFVLSHRKVRGVWRPASGPMTLTLTLADAASNYSHDETRPRPMLAIKMTLVYPHGTGQGDMDTFAAEEAAIRTHLGTGTTASHAEADTAVGTGVTKILDAAQEAGLSPSVMRLRVETFTMLDDGDAAAEEETKDTDE